MERKLTDRAGVWLWTGIVLSFLASAALLAPFTAEDAYILYRYVENLHRHGELVFNAGERINALTSPLHAGVLAGLYAVTQETEWTNKALGLLLAVAGFALVARRYRKEPLPGAVAASLLLPSCVVLWTFGGLETPLLAFLALGATLTLLGPATGRRTCLVCGLSALGVLTRYDAVLFFAPVALQALWMEPSWRRRAGGVALGLVICSAWLVFARAYYADIFPTSLYIKPPGSTSLVRNTWYVAAWLVLCGLVPALLATLPALERPALIATRARWGLIAGLALQLGYDLTIATTHMMFSFRSFTPYLGAAGVLLAELARTGEPGRGRGVMLAYVIAACALHPLHAAYTWSRSLNGLSPLGEFRNIGSRAFMDDFMEALRAQATAIRTHWAEHAPHPRPLRLYTYAGGVAPHALPEAYVYESLVSYRHGRPRLGNWSAYADYAMVVTPYFGPPPDPADWNLIWQRDFLFNGRPQSFRVYFNPRPLPHPLGNRIDRP